MLITQKRVRWPPFFYYPIVISMIRCNFLQSLKKFCEGGSVVTFPSFDSKGHGVQPPQVDSIFLYSCSTSLIFLRAIFFFSCQCEKTFLRKNIKPVWPSVRYMHLVMFFYYYFMSTYLSLYPTGEDLKKGSQLKGSFLCLRNI